FSRASHARLKVGVSEARMRNTPTATPAFDTYPVAEGVFEHSMPTGGHLDARIGVRLGPTVNRLFGVGDERLEGTLGASHRLRRLTTRATASGSRSVMTPAAFATSLVAGEVSVAYDATRVVAIDGGMRALWQRQDATGATFSQGTMFIGVTFKAPPLRW